ncbi:unnamed protein product [Ilex paraguariensis]|uniref:SCP domain-containing protein n=1 Tax=Ilex paraguariensis TaxID=185542 RepID=A0ABC8RLE0_9AQUA
MERKTMEGEMIERERQSAERSNVTCVGEEDRDVLQWRAWTGLSGGGGGGGGGGLTQADIGRSLVMFHSSQAQNSPQDYLNAHNAARSQVGAGPLTWDNKVASYAQNYANQRINDCNLKHSQGQYGENLATATPTLSGTSAVNLWVGERVNYDHNSNSCTGGQCGHYTQVVWRNSVRLGCARVQCKNGWWFVTCNYDPPGNVIGQRPY